MKFVASEDIRAPEQIVWGAVTDFDRFENLARPRADRLDRSPAGPAGVGTTWTARAVISGKKRDIRVELMELAPQRLVRAEGGTDGMMITVEAVVEAKGQGVTRLTVVTEVKARTLAARLLLQSAKLARQSLTKRYRKRVASFAARIEAELVG